MSAPANARVAGATPRARLGDGRTALRRGWEVFLALTTARVRQERELTPTGIAKWMLEPITYMFVYFVLIAGILRRSLPAYPLFLLSALLPFRYFSGVLGGSMSVIGRHSSVLANRAFPRIVLPPVVMATEATTLVLSLGLLIPIGMAVYRIPPTLHLLWVPLVLAVLVVLASGAGYIGAVFGLYFPDFRGPVNNLTRVLFFMSTGLVRARDIPGDELPQLLKANPLSGIFDSMRNAIMYGRAPELGALLYPFLFGVVLLAVGLALYRWRAQEFAKEV